jgi:hypothetical protein
MRNGILLILVTSLAGSATVRADPLDTQRQIIAQQRAQQQGYIKRLRELPGKKKIHEILQVHNQHGKLELSSSLFDHAQEMKNQQFRAQVEGFEGDCTLSVQPFGQAGNVLFAFTNTSYPNLEGQCTFTVRQQPGMLQISRSYSGQMKTQAVSLMQSQGRALFGALDGVQLIVNVIDRGRLAKNVNLLEPDFATLLHKHPREVDEYLRPLLRELKLDNLFAVDDTTAWQVFADQWQGNPKVASEVARLLPELDRDVYPAREAARQALIELGPDAALVVYRMNRQGLSPEQRCQLDALLTLNSFVSRAEAARLKTSSDFLLDCLYSQNPTIRQIAAHGLAEKLKHEVTVDATDAEKRAQQVEALRTELGRGATTPEEKG